MRHHRMSDLVEMNYQDPVVRTHFEMWHRGEFPTLEQMLLSLACTQTLRCKTLEGNLAARVQQEAMPSLFDIKPVANFAPHVHEASQTYRDRCELCGKDIRDEIHIREATGG